MLIGVLGLGISIAQSQTLVNSWENSLEGWSILETGTWTSVGFSTAKGVTQGSYSWELNTTGVDYGSTLQGPASTNLTLLMANAASVTMTLVVGTNAPQFNWGIQIDLAVNQPGGVGFMSVDGGNYPGDVYSPHLTDGSTNLLTWPVSQAVRTALDQYPNLPVSLVFSFGGGGGGTVFIDNLQVTKIPQVQANLWVRELWDDLGTEKDPASTSVYDNSSSAGFDVLPWVPNPAETNNCSIMAFRPGFNNEPLVGASTMGLPGSLDGSFGCLVQQNNGFNFVGGGNSFWTAGDFLTRQLNTGNYINFQAQGEYWFSMTIANDPTSLDGQYVTFPASGWMGIGFADGSTTNANFVAIGVTGPNVYIGPTNVSNPWGQTNVSKAVYISQGTLGQPGNTNSTLYNPLLDLSANPPDQPPNYAPPYNTEYTQTNFTSGPYHINSFGAQTVGHVSDSSGHNIVVLGHLVTFGDGTARLDAKYYGVGVGGNPWNTDLDQTTNSITWDCSYSFSYGGTMTRMLLFENGQFPDYMFGFRAGANFNSVVGLDPGRIAVAPLTNTYVGYAINMTNLAVEANSYSFASPPAGYGTLAYQWYQNGVAISGATSQFLNIASASLTDPNMPSGTDAGTYTSVATDPSGTWGSITDSVTIAVTQLAAPQVSGVQLLHNGNTFAVTYNQPNLTGIGNTNHYVFTGGVAAIGATVFNTSTSSVVQVTTTALPLGTRISLTISDATNVVGGTLVATNLTFWTDLVQTGVANWDAWLTTGAGNNYYFNTFLPANPTPLVGQSMALTSWDGPSSGVSMVGEDGYVGDWFGDKVYGWFIPPVTANYVFLISADDGARLSLSTNSSSTNLFVIACETDWSGNDQWTNIADTYGQGIVNAPHRGDGTATGVGPTGYVWDNSVSGQSPATACLQNRSDQFIVAFYDSTGLPGGPAGATNQANWATYADEQIAVCIPPGMTNFWPQVDANGQALIHLQAGQMYYMQLEHTQTGGGYGEGVTYKIAGTPDPLSPTASIMTGSNIAGTVPFTPTISIVETNGAPLITYTGVLLTGTNLFSITNVVAQSSAATAISLGGPSQYSVPHTAPSMFYRTSK
jgi:hypothetical protein